MFKNISEKPSIKLVIIIEWVLMSYIVDKDTGNTLKVSLIENLVDIDQNDKTKMTHQLNMHHCFISRELLVLMTDFTTVEVSYPLCYKLSKQSP